MNIQIEDRHLKIVLEILKKYPYTFYVFGSRAKHNAKRFSDLDLCFLEKIPGNIIIKIEEDFEESDLPYKVDLVDINRCDADFKEIILKDMKQVL